MLLSILHVLHAPLPPPSSSFPPSLLLFLIPYPPSFLLILPSSSSFLPPPPSFLLECRRLAPTPPRERGGGHHVRGRAGSWGLSPQRPARALPLPGLHAPISEEPLGGVGGKSASEGEVPKAVLPWRVKPMGKWRRGVGPPFMEQFLCCLGAGLGGLRSRSGVVRRSRCPVRIGHCPELAAVSPGVLCAARS